MKSVSTDNKMMDAADTNTVTTVLPANQDKSQKTTGEKYYTWLKFGAAEAFILAATAVIAYVARYVKSPLNIFKHIQDGFEWLLKPLTKIGKEGSKTREIGTTVAAAGASTMVTFHGGNAFAPPMKWFENGKEKIVGYFNRKFGKPGEEALGHERLKSEPKQTWVDVIKGRLAAWGIVFVSFVSAGILAGKDKKTGMARFDKFEEGFGRKLAGWTKGGKEIGKLSVTEMPKLPEELAKNRTYRFGKILALDIYATTAAIVIWNAISALSAKARGKKETAPDLLPPEPIIKEVVAENDAQPSAGKPRRFADSAKPQESYADMVSKQKSNEAMASPSV